MSLRDAPAAHETVSSRYAARVQAGKIERDPAQEAVAAALDRLAAQITAQRLAHKGSALGWLFGKSRNAQAPVKGLYLHGGVGRGKTMLMDIFFDLLPGTSKRRAHFNDFMADAHDRIAQHRLARKAGETDEDDPIAPVAKALASQACVLCFDEFAVTDIADAMILSRLFAALFAKGVVLVATSNVAPQDLYRDGLNRALFEPFLDLLRRHADAIAFDKGKDYRIERMKRLPVYLCPLGPEADRGMDAAWAAATAGRTVAPTTVPVMGREIAVRQAAGDAARFTFSELCEAPLAARDYLALTARFASFFVENIPVLTAEHRNAAKRLILLVDTLYDRRARLVASAAAAPNRLYQEPVGTEAFEFARTASRLWEMQGQGWIEGSKEHAADRSE